MLQQLENRMGYLADPADGAFVITPNNVTDMQYETRAIRVGGSAGNLQVLTREGETVTIPNVQVGETLAIRATRVLATETTATGIIGFY